MSESTESLRVPSGWVNVPLGAVASLINGDRGRNYPSGAAFVDAGIAFVNAGHLSGGRVNLAEMNFITEERFNLLQSGKVRDGDVLFCLRGSLGKVAVVQGLGSGAIASSLVIVRSAESVLPPYLLYYFISPLADRMIRRYDNGTAQPNLAAADLKRFAVPLAPLREQRRIVAKIEELFSDLDAGVAALERVRANLKRYRAAVLKAAVEGRLTEEWRTRHPTTEPAAKLLERILTERRAKWEQDQLRKFKEAGKTPPKGWKENYKRPVDPDVEFLPMAPKGWAVASVDQLSTIITSGSRDWTQYYGRGTGTFIMAQNVRPGRLDLSSRTVVDPPEGDRDSERSQVERDDLLVTIVGANTGDVCRVPESLPEHHVCQSVALMRPVLPAVSPYVEWYLVSEENGQKQFGRYIYGQGRPHLGFDQIRMTAVLLPPLAEQAEIVAEVDRRLSVADAAETQVEHALQRAARLRQAILKRAFEGKLVPQDPRDKPAEKLLERVSARVGADTVTSMTAPVKKRGKTGVGA